MKRREFIRTASYVAAGNALMQDLMGSQAQASAQKKPNILFVLMFVLADDPGIGGVVCYGADKFKTPIIDKLAREGTRYTHGYTAPLCGPSRACILTGRYAFRTGATNQDATGGMEPTVETFLPKGQWVVLCRLASQVQ